MQFGEVETSVRPTLLMLSRAVPDARASRDRRFARWRAWQLLALAHRTHEVHLVCVADGGVSLGHWRRLHRVAQRVVIEPRRPLLRACAAAAQRLTGAVIDERRMTPTLTETIAQLCGQTGYDAAVGIGASLGRAACAAGASQVLIDVATDRSLRPHHAGRMFDGADYLIADSRISAAWGAESRRLLTIDDASSAATLLPPPPHALPLLADRDEADSRRLARAA